MGVPGRFVLPRAHLPAHPAGRAWWPIDSEAREAVLATTGARDLAFSVPTEREPARKYLADLLRSERAHAPHRPCVLAGFSQGGMLACDTLLHESVHVDALALLSSSCIDFNVWQLRRERLAGLTTMVAHGVHDADLALAAGQRLRDFCIDAGAVVSWLPFEGGHQIPLPVWRELRRLIRAVVAGPADLATAA